jgi:Recombinase zinc beta ribbon domain
VSSNNKTTESPACVPCRGDDADIYLLRGLVWCAVCDQAMAPRLSQGMRQYGCSRNCPRPHVSAQRAERLVWERFADLNPAIADRVPLDNRHKALRQVLGRLWVGREVHDLYYEWRD